MKNEKNNKQDNKIIKKIKQILKWINERWFPIMFISIIVYILIIGFFSNNFEYTSTLISFGVFGDAFGIFNALAIIFILYNVRADKIQFNKTNIRKDKEKEEEKESIKLIIVNEIERNYLYLIQCNIKDANTEFIELNNDLIQVHLVSVILYIKDYFSDDLLKTYSDKLYVLSEDEIKNIFAAYRFIQTINSILNIAGISMKSKDGTDLINGMKIQMKDPKVVLNDIDSSIENMKNAILSLRFIEEDSEEFIKLNTHESKMWEEIGKKK